MTVGFLAETSTRALQSTKHTAAQPTGMVTNNAQPTWR
jgi:hypothetical protein